MSAKQAQLPEGDADDKAAGRRGAAAPDRVSCAGGPQCELPDDAPLPRLAVALVAALLRRGYERVPPAAINTTISVCGLFMLISPLLLWIAWSAGIALILWTMIGVCFLIICLIAWVAPGEPF